MKTFVASDGLRLHYVVDDFTDPWRVSETLILLHAAMGSSRRFYAWVPHLARHMRVVRLDLRGHGRSEIPDILHELTIDRLALDVVELLDELGCESAQVAGSSAGGIVAQQVAITYPHKVGSLALFASKPGMKKSNIDYGTWLSHIEKKGLRGFLEDTIQIRFDLSQQAPAFIEWFLDESARNDPEFLARFVTLMASVDLRDQLGKIQCPTLIVVPGNDPLGPIDYYQVFRERIPNVEFVVYDGLPHNITDAVPDRCAEELKRFLLKLG
ncbi:MAG: alpha/beta hydrolase [Planctomycetota bacterium]